VTNFSSNVCHEDATQDESEEDLKKNLIIYVTFRLEFHLGSWV
jgi:hypothetical protein